MAQPIPFSYTPKGLSYTKLSVSSCSEFTFLKASAIDKAQKSSYDIPIQPLECDVPWPSSFPAVRQCKYWKEVQTSCEDLMQEIRALRNQNTRMVPEGFSHMGDEQRLTKKESMIIATAVSSATYMVPNSPRDRIEAIAKLWMLLWTHDDVVEYSPEQAGSTVVDDMIGSLLRVARGFEDLSGNEACATFKLTTELLDLPGGLMQTLLETFEDFLVFTSKHQRSRFEGLRDFLDYRMIDIAMTLILASVRLGNGLDLNRQQLEPLRHIIDLTSDHITLVNDLYSFDKEKRAAVTEGALLLNTVNYLEQALSVSSPFAKDLTLRLILDIESKLQDELGLISQTETLSESQVRYAHALVECASGNWLFSITSIRYGKEMK
ncbi:terpene synthase family protein [Aspergillus affinis]|uniref:terpene synthase family protein n=1 Tax=Aspergillus affinis TaxID=1070780 RepID=UPI0022FEB45D|nr:terpenoid synthase [Aspergillus affinis]KAI9040026.1 terpenoid synthase [Aspergillus affinis]